MNSPALIYALRWLTWDTFRQAAASRVFAVLLGVNLLCILFCLGVSVEGGDALKQADDLELYDRQGQPLTGPNPNPGHLKLAFGAVRIELFRDGEAGVHFLMVLMAKWVAGAAGLLLALVWTAGFVPDFLQPSAASVLLAKPTPRWTLVLGKYCGVVLFVALNAFIFFAGTWLALGVRTGAWLPGYLAGIPLLVVHFAVIYSFSVLLGVLTRSTVACVLGAVLFWMICFGVNYARHAALALPQLAPEAAPYPASFLALIETSYWLLPKPADFVIILDSALGAGEHFGTLPEFAAVQSLNALDPVLSMASSLLFAAGMLALASHQLADTDY
jgi:ABC-type transport system involved in multi-copper enzyme maturation permease subunit